MRKLCVLIAEDSEDDAMLLLRELRKGGYDPEYERVDSADALAHALAAREWDLVISDYVMPGFSGLDALRMVRENGNKLPFIMVSGKMGEETAVEVMRAGAQDYVLKGRFARMLPAIERELRDAEERRQAEEDKKIAAVQWQTTFDAAHDLFLLLDKEYRITRVNQAALRLLGLPAGAIIGRHCYDLIHGTDAPPPECPLTKFYNTRVHEEAEFLNTKFNIWLSASVDPVFDENGNIVQIVHILRDITERKRSEEAFLAQFRQISTIFDELSVIVYVIDPVTSELLYLNKFGTSIFGTDWQGRDVKEVIPGDHPHLCPLTVMSPDSHGAESNAQHIFDSKNPLTNRWYHCVEKKISWVDGRLVHVTVAVDITDLKDMMQMKDELLSAVSHEMRTPLTAISGYIDLILEDNLEEEILREYLAIIQKESLRLNELLINFLSLQQLKAKSPIDNCKPVALRPLLEEVAKLFMAQSAKHRILIDLMEDLPAILVDEGSLHRVLNNLVFNAIKYSPEGGDVLIGAQRGANETVTLWVKDEGIGMPPEVLEKIFDRFYQVESGDRRTFSGAGLGLALVRETVKTHGGEVWVESVLGKGSTFFISLPSAPFLTPGPEGFAPPSA